ncbi:hypothetical protein KIM372_06210 [Bombiscardovia nodaiensis]|uniref:Uncharacterized protein n=1 Tax=Bombiscardovia nodaiensis TaxID=2932181 RepID=A0ABN6S970_9BIFI|nr:hypothetical protein KIM372_06210 [Bombiscardovia nodaiensis]
MVNLWGHPDLGGYACSGLPEGELRARLDVFNHAQVVGLSAVSVVCGYAAALSMGQPLLADPHDDATSMVQGLGFLVLAVVCWYIAFCSSPRRLRLGRVWCPVVMVLAVVLVVRSLLLWVGRASVLELVTELLLLLAAVGVFWLTGRVDVAVDPGLPQAGWDGPGMYRRAVCMLTASGLAFPPIAVVLMWASEMMVAVDPNGSFTSGIPSWWLLGVDYLLMAVVIVVFSVLALWAALHPSNRVLVVSKWLSRVALWLAGVLCVVSVIALHQDKRFLGLAVEALLIPVALCPFMLRLIRKVVEH